MPIGYCSLVPAIATQLVVFRPGSVLDLRIGMGFYGAVARQWLDGGVQPWRTRLVGVEAFAAYLGPCWNLYDEVAVSSIERFLETNADHWDAILLLDVLEHFEHAQGEAILRELRRRLSCGGRLFVGTPAVWMDQGAAYGNEFERHRSLWTADELRSPGFELLADGITDRFGNQMLLGVAAN
ncbi:MAG: methyltransferase domain-containing protein [Planctomycetota bacterium]